MEERIGTSLVCQSGGGGEGSGKRGKKQGGRDRKSRQEACVKSRVETKGQKQPSCPAVVLSLVSFFHLFFMPQVMDVAALSICASLHCFFLSTLALSPSLFFLFLFLVLIPRLSLLSHSWLLYCCLPRSYIHRHTHTFLLLRRC